MKKITTLVVAALVMAFGVSAMADGREHDGDKGDQFIKCKFRGDAGKSKGNSYCYAWAKIEQDRKGPHPIPTPPAPGTLNDRDRDRDGDRGREDAFLKVVCDGEEIFEGDADVDHKGRFTVIEADHKDITLALSNKSWDRAVSAWLSIEDGSSLRGFCEVRGDRDHDDDDQDDDMDFLF